MGPQSQAHALQMHGGQDSLERVRSCASLEQTKVTRKLNTGGWAGMYEGCRGFSGQWNWMHLIIHLSKPTGMDNTSPGNPNAK